MTDQPCVGEHSNQYFGGRPIFRIKGNRLAAPAGLFMHLIQAGRALRINRFFQQTRPRYQIYMPGPFFFGSGIFIWQ